MQDPQKWIETSFTDSLSAARAILVAANDTYIDAEKQFMEASQEHRREYVRNILPLSDSPDSPGMDTRGKLMGLREAVVEA